MPFQERLELLIQSGQADELSAAATRLAVQLVEQHYGIELTEEWGASLVNHLAVTLKRIIDGESLTKAPDEVWQELLGYPEEVTLAEVIVAQLEKMLSLSLARDELGFIAIHLCKIKIEAGLDHR